MDALRRKFSHLRSIDGLGSTVCAVAAAKYFGIRRLHIFIDDDSAFFRALAAKTRHMSIAVVGHDPVPAKFKVRFAMCDFRNRSLPYSLHDAER